MVSFERSDQKESLLSIVIPTARYTPYLAKFLLYLKKVCNENDVEIIIVSTDDNPANKLYKVLCEHIDCKLLIVKRKFGNDIRARQMNLGVRHSNSKYVYILADDMFVSCRFLKSLKEVLAKNVDAVLHAAIPRPISIWSKVRTIEKTISSFNLYQSSCRIIRKDVFIKLGGYREDLVVGEDMEFQDRLLRLKPKIAVIPVHKGFEVHLGEYRSLSAYVKRAYYYGKHLKTLLHKISAPRVTYAYIFPPLNPLAMLKIYRYHVLYYVIYKITTIIATICGRLF